MNEAFIDILRAAGPTAVSNPVEVYCEVGWLPLLYHVVTELHWRNLAVAPERRARLDHCKEKFGGLRLSLGYSLEGLTDADHDFYAALVKEAEDASWLTCEYCGHLGKRRVGGKWTWVKVRCDSCQAEYERK